MKRIGILSCRNAGQVCAGVGCLRAFFRRESAFSAYGEEPLELVAFLHCNGCEGVEDQGPFDHGIFPPLASEPGLLEKLDRLQQEQVDVVHLGICCWNRQGEECPAIIELSRELQRRNIAVVKGTHF